MRSIQLLLGSLYFVFSFTYLLGQGNTQSIVIRQDTSTIRTEVLIDGTEISHHLDRTYYGYYQNDIRPNQGGHVGRLLHGDFQRISSAGKLLEQGRFDSGLKEGEWTLWQAEGVLQATYTYQHGKREGLFREYDEDGQLYRTGYYFRDQLHGKITYHPDTEEERVEKYRNGALQEEVAQKEKKAKPPKTKRTKPPRQKAVVADASNKDRPKKRKRKQEQESGMIAAVTQESADRAALPPEVVAQLSRMPPRSVAVFVVQGVEEEPLVSASVKVVGYQNGQSASETFSGFTGSDGVYYLRRDSADYVLTVSHPKFEKSILRINRHDLRPSYLLKVKTAVDCGRVVGSVQRAQLSTGLVGIQVEILDQQEKVLTKVYSQQDGTFDACLPCGKKYQARLSRDGYPTTLAEFSTPGNCRDAATRPVFFLEKERSAVTSRPVNTPPASNTVIAEGALEVAPSTPVTTSVPPSAPITHTGIKRYAVVAGSFSNQANAEKRRAQVASLGYGQATIDFQEATQTYAVIVGKADQEAKANEIMRTFRRKTRLKAFIRDAQQTN